jgi:hypothetical protein
MSVLSRTTSLNLEGDYPSFFRVTVPMRHKAIFFSSAPERTRACDGARTTGSSGKLGRSVAVVDDDDGGGGSALLPVWLGMKGFLSSRGGKKEKKKGAIRRVLSRKRPGQQVVWEHVKCLTATGKSKTSATVAQIRSCPRRRTNRPYSLDAEWRCVCV